MSFPGSIDGGIDGGARRSPDPGAGAADLPRAELDWHDKYLRLLCFSLAGYALFGKGFAYVGYPPLLIGEVAMLLGVLVLLRSGCWIATLSTVPSVLVAALLLLVMLSTAVDFRTYGLESVRDSAVVLYALFTFVVIALLLEDPRRLGWIVDAYSGFAWWYGLLGAAMVYVTTAFSQYLPIWPLSGVSLVYVKLNEAAVHLSGVAVFMLLGFRAVSPLWLFVLIVSITMITPSRGAMLSCLVPIGVAAVVGRQFHRLMPVLLFAGALFVLALVSGIEIETQEGRGLGAQRIVENVQSIFGTSASGNLDGTKQWRLRWWQTIEDYTFRGPYFWTGKGFGMSLAETDGFVVGVERGGPILRSPHNAHYTLLARAGVPGLALWLAVLAAWFIALLRAMLTARRNGDVRWANLFLWTGCYVLAIVIDASFDVALEGPMLGIWFWSLFGFGIASTMIYRWEKAGGRGSTLGSASGRGPELSRGS
jgi:hypothetical protein